MYTGVRERHGSPCTLVSLLLLLSAAVFISTSENGKAGTFVGGSITIDTVWTLAGSPYYVVSSVYIEATATLRIEPGVEVRFDFLNSLVIMGRLLAVGTQSTPIRFTANTTSPSLPYWQGIETRFDGRLSMSWVNITHAYEALVLQSSNNSIEDCEISQSFRVRIWFDGLMSSGPVSNNSITRCYLHGNFFAPAWSTIDIGGGLLNSYGHKIKDSKFEENDADGIRISQSSQDLIENNLFTRLPNGRAIVLANASDTFVTGNTMESTLHGLYMTRSGTKNNTVRGNTMLNSTFFGICFDGRWYVLSRNLVEDNLIAGTWRGISLTGAGVNNNTIRNNTLLNNYVGIEVNRTSIDDGLDYGPPLDNIIYHNRIINNTKQAIDNTTPTGNSWDIGCPGGGNFWSDYTGVDQTDCITGLPGGDGLGDTPYIIDSDSRDNYPLTTPTPVDRMPPEMFNATINEQPRYVSPLSSLGQVTLRVIADDTFTGGSKISSGNFTIGPRDWATSAPMSADDGGFDEVNETLQATINPSPTTGDHVYCAYATDSAGNGNTTGVCATLTVVDDLPPRILNVTVDGQRSRSIPVGTPSVLLEAIMDDSTTGGSVIGGANFTSPARNWSGSAPMVPRDILDTDVESFFLVVDTSSRPPGTYDLCVYGWDIVPNRNTTGSCAVLTVLAGPATNPDYVPFMPQPPFSLRTGLSSIVSLSVQVLNQGNATATSNATLAFYDDIPPSPPFDVFSVTPLNPSTTSSRYGATWLSPATPGTYYVSADADYYDNVTEWDETNNVYTWTIEVVSGPVTSLVIGSPNHTSAVTYVRSSTPLDFSILDQSGAGIRYTNYSIDGGAWTNYTATGTFFLSGEGERTIEWFSEDYAGNVENVSSIVLRVDNTPPATSYSVGDPKHQAAQLFVRSATAINLTSVDRGVTPVGLATIEYLIDGGIWNPYSSNITLTGSDGPHTVYYRSRDLLGNEETEKSLTLFLDNTPPATTISPATGEFNTITSFTLTATDGGSGVKVTRYSIDGGTWTDYSGSFTIPEGDHNVSYHSVDNLDNTELEKWLAVTIQGPPPPNTPPTVTLTSPTGGEEFLKGSSHTITWTMHDNEDANANLTVYVNYTSGGTTVSIVGAVKGLESFLWTLPYIEASDVVVNITVVDTGGLKGWDQSGPFTIKAAPPPPEEKVETNYKPIVALVFTVILTVGGLWSSRKRPWKGRNDRMAVAKKFMTVALPFVLAEAGTGVVSLLTGHLSIPPLLGIGTAVDMGILTVGVAVIRTKRLQRSKGDGS